MIRAVLLYCFGVLYVPRGFAQKLVLNQELLDYAQTLRPKYKVGLFSNMNAGAVDKYFTREQLQQYFDSVVISGEVGATKPQPESYNIAAEASGADLAECLLIDDLQSNCDGALRVGMRALLYDSTDQIKNELPKAIDA